MLEKAIEILTKVKDNLLDYQNEERIELNNVIDILEEINNKQNTFIIKSFSEDDSYFIIPESLEEKFDEFEYRLENINNSSFENMFKHEKMDEILEEFYNIFDEYSYENLSTIKIKGVIERE